LLVDLYLLWPLPSAASLLLRATPALPAVAAILEGAFALILGGGITLLSWLEAGASLSILGICFGRSGGRLLGGNGEEVVLEVLDLLLKLAAGLRLEAIQQVLLQVVKGLQLGLDILWVQT